MPISPEDSNKILIVAAEASSCMYAKNLMQQWGEKHPNASFFGIGDKKMQEQGMNCLGYAEDLAVVGLLEVLKDWKAIRKTWDSLLEQCEKTPPQFAILLDYPGFNLRLAKKLKAMGIPVVYYISPQLWAWKKGRVKQIKKYVDEMLVVFPFEVDFYKKHNVEAHFVGHPLIETIQQEKNSAPPVQLNKVGSQVVGLMPGSRKSELKYNLQTQVEAGWELQQSAGVDVALLVAPTLNLEEVKVQAGEKAKGFHFIQASPTQMIEACDVLISASGTATLQIALCGKPFVVMYRMNPVTAFLAKLLVRTVDYFCIVNLILNKKVVEEYFQAEATAKNLSQEASLLLQNSEKKKNMLQSFEEIRTLLGAGQATKNVVEFLESRF